LIVTEPISVASPPREDFCKIRRVCGFRWSKIRGAWFQGSYHGEDSDGDLIHRWGEIVNDKLLAPVWRAVLALPLHLSLGN